MIKNEKHPLNHKLTFLVIGPMPFSMKSIAPLLKDENTRLVFIDGGLIHKGKLLKKAPLLYKESISVGDGDSSKKQMTITKIDQNLSDLSFFLKTFSRQNNIGRFVFAGFLGGRVDHEVVNFGEMILYIKSWKKKSPLPRLCFEDKVEFLAAGRHEFWIDGIFSVASLEDNHIKVSGECAYQAKKWLKIGPLSSRGLSNQGQGKVVIQTKKPLMVFFPGL